MSNIMQRVTRVTTGAFLLSSAMLVQADQVILDDLIVDGSICVGMDCVNGESFGFDTIRLKENNLRIKFEDTSNSASFPSRDWQITVNDSANGGANKFSIDDIDGGRTPFTIEAGAPTHSLYVDDSGRLGLGTSTPVVDVHVKSGNTPTLRLEQDGSSGFTPQTWDVAGNEANFFIRDATNGSTLPFRIYPGAPSNSINIEASTGDVGIGTTSPDARLHIDTNSNGAPSFLINDDGSGGADFIVTEDGNVGVGGVPIDLGWAMTNLYVKAQAGEHGLLAIDSDNAAHVAQISLLSAGVLKWHLSAQNNFSVPNDRFGIFGPAGESLTILADGRLGIGVNNPSYQIEHSSGAVLANGVWTNASSRSFKNGIKELNLDDAYKAVMALEPVRFSYNSNPNEEYIGFIAEDVPDLVATSDRKGLPSMDVVAVLTKVVQEQQKHIEILSKEMNELKNRINGVH